MKASVGLPLLLLASFAAAMPAMADSVYFQLEFGLTTGDGLPIGTGPQTPVHPSMTADGTSALGNYDSDGEKVWQAGIGLNGGQNSLSTISPTDYRYLPLGGWNSAAYYNPYDQIANGPGNFSSDGDSPNCVGAVFVLAYSCTQTETKAVRIRSIPVDGIESIQSPQQHGSFHFDPTSGYLTAGAQISPFTYRIGDGTPTYAARHVVGDPESLGSGNENIAVTLTLNTTPQASDEGLFSLHFTGGMELLSPDSGVCNPGDLSGLACLPGPMGSFQADGSHLSWRNIPVYDKVESDPTRVLLTTIPGVVLDAVIYCKPYESGGPVLGGCQITSASGEYHRAVGSAQCPNSLVYANGAITCGSLIAGRMVASGASCIVEGCFPLPAVPLPAGGWLLGSALAGLWPMRRVARIS